MPQKHANKSITSHNLDAGEYTHVPPMQPEKKIDT